MKKILILAVVVGVVAVVAKCVAATKSGWQGMSETEVRDKIDANMPAKVPAEKRTAMADKVVAKMRDKGVLLENEEPTADTAAEPAGDDGASEEDAQA